MTGWIAEHFLFSRCPSLGNFGQRGSRRK